MHKLQFFKMIAPGTDNRTLHPPTVTSGGETRPGFWLPVALAALMLLTASMLRTGENRVDVVFIPGVPGTAEALKDNDSVFWLGVDMQIKEGWHIYWRNPGDSGLPTSIRWDPHPSLKPGEIQWPRPARFDENGITTYGYSGRVTLLVPVSVTRDELLPDSGTSGSHGEAQPNGLHVDGDGTETNLSADLNWLVCKDICLPESARITLDVTASGHFTGFSENGVRQIKHSLDMVPEQSAEWQGYAVLDDGHFHITLTPASDHAAIPDLQHVYFYPDRQGLIEHTAPQKAVRDGNKLTIAVPVSRYLRTVPEELSGVLSAGESWIHGKDAPAIEMVLPVSTLSERE